MIVIMLILKTDFERNYQKNFQETASSWHFTTYSTHQFRKTSWTFLMKVAGCFWN